MKLPALDTDFCRWSKGLLLLGLCLPHAQAVILYSTGDPSANTTAPTGPLANSGWQYENTFLSYTGYPISPDSFVVSKHIVGSYHQGSTGGTTFTYMGVTYNTVGRFDDPNGGDLTVLKINPAAPAGAFPSFVPLYRKNDETGQNFVVLGRGLERGAEVNIPADATTAGSPNGTLRGWVWGGNSGVQRWGENQVEAIGIANSPGVHEEFLLATFTPPAQGGLPNEATLAAGDSSGGVFIKDTADGIWKLAALNTGVVANFSTTSGGAAVNMALIDAGGLFVGPNQLQDTTGLDLFFNAAFQSTTLLDPNLRTPVVSLHTRISSLTTWLDSVAVPESTPSPALLGAALLVGAGWLVRRQRAA